MPVDIALVSSTSSSKLGVKKDWATPEKVEGVLYALKVVYYCLYSADALLCLLVIPFTYFWFEEGEDEEGATTVGKKLWGAAKYTIFFLLVVVILFLVGFFVPFAKGIREGKNRDLDYFKKLITENREFRSGIGT